MLVKKRELKAEIESLKESLAAKHDAWLALWEQRHEHTSMIEQYRVTVDKCTSRISDICEANRVLKRYKEDAEAEATDLGRRLIEMQDVLYERNAKLNQAESDCQTLARIATDQQWSLQNQQFHIDIGFQAVTILRRRLRKLRIAYSGWKTIARKYMRLARH